MKLDRNTNKNGLGKYALVLLRKIKGLPSIVLDPISSQRSFLVPEHALDLGNTTDTDFFVIRLRDKCAPAALFAYADAALAEGMSEYAEEIRALAVTASRHPRSKLPD